MQLALMSTGLRQAADPVVAQVRVTWKTQSLRSTCRRLLARPDSPCRAGACGQDGCPGRARRAATGGHFPAAGACGGGREQGARAAAGLRDHRGHGLGRAAAPARHCVRAAPGLDSCRTSLNPKEPIRIAICFDVTAIIACNWLPKTLHVNTLKCPSALVYPLQARETCANRCLWPQVWSAAALEMQPEDKDTGAVSRLHSALIAVMTHIISRLGADALGNPEVQQFSCPLVIPFIVQHCYQQ